MEVIPIFKSCYSLGGRSMLTLNEKGKSVEYGPDSIIDLALSAGLKKVVLVDDSMGGFLEANANCEAAGLKLVFGYRVSLCPTLADKSDKSYESTSKIVIFAKNHEGYKKLIKISSFANKAENSYYEARLDIPALKQFWDDKDLKLTIPFYDSFLYKNFMTFAVCIPDLSFTEPVFFIEDNKLPFDPFIAEQVKNYVGGKFEIQKVKSIYYARREDLKALITLKCMNNRGYSAKPSVLGCPNRDHLSSAEFCFESWRECK